MMPTTTPTLFSICMKKGLNWTSKIKNFCLAKDTVKRLRQKPQPGKNTYLTEVFLISKIYKELLKNSTIEKNTPQFRQTTYQQRYTGSKKAYEKMLNIICQKGIAN